MKRLILLLICILLMLSGCDAEFTTGGDVLGAYGTVTEEKKEDKSYLLTWLCV